MKLSWFYKDYDEVKQGELEITPDELIAINASDFIPDELKVALNQHIINSLKKK